MTFVQAIETKTPCLRLKGGIVQQIQGVTNPYQDLGKLASLFPSHRPHKLRKHPLHAEKVNDFCATTPDPQHTHTYTHTHSRSKPCSAFQTVGAGGNIRRRFERRFWGLRKSSPLCVRVLSMESYSVGIWKECGLFHYFFFFFFLRYSFIS